MNRRVLVLAVVVAAAVVVVGLSAAATISSRGEPTKAKPARQSADVGPSSSPKSQQQSPDDVASYWTKERMRDAQPIEKTVTGTTRPTASVPSSPGRTSPARAPDSATTTESKPQKRKTGAEANGPSKAPSASGDAGDYWTQDRMDDAQPLEKSPTGDAGGSSPGLPGGSGSTTPPAVP